MMRLSGSILYPIGTATIRGEFSTRAITVYDGNAEPHVPLRASSFEKR